MRSKTLLAIGCVLITSRYIQRRLRQYDLNGKTVLITGGSRGLGLVLAREFGRRGARIAICSRDPGELDRAEHELRGRGHPVLGVVCDVTSREMAESAAAEVRGHFGAIDVLVNNAGVITVGPSEVMSGRDFQESLETHFWGPYHMTQAVLPEMRARHGGRIVNISSIGGKISVPHLLPYCVGKFALTGYSEGLRSELLKDNIYVTTVCPGLMRTGSPRNANFKGQHRKEFAWFSISGSSPFTSISAERAARRIVRACVTGEGEVVLSVPAMAAAKFQALFPGATSDLLGAVNRILPSPTDSKRESHAGRESGSAVSPSWLTVLDEQAARENNEEAA